MTSRRVEFSVDSWRMRPCSSVGLTNMKEAHMLRLTHIQHHIAPMSQWRPGVRPIPPLITCMILYEHGVGYFERRARFTGERVDLSFRVEEMNDVLKKPHAPRPGRRPRARRGIHHAPDAALSGWTERPSSWATRAACRTCSSDCAGGEINYSRVNDKLTAETLLMISSEQYARIARNLPILQEADPQLVRDFQQAAFFAAHPGRAKTSSSKAIAPRLSPC